jgi:predicted CopG family antitoxin
MEMSEEKYTSIRLRQSTAEQLKEMGRKGESYDDIIAWLLKNSKKRKASFKADYRLLKSP